MIQISPRLPGKCLHLEFIWKLEEDERFGLTMDKTEEMNPHHSFTGETFLAFRKVEQSWSNNTRSKFWWLHLEDITVWC